MPRLPSHAPLRPYRPLLWLVLLLLLALPRLVALDRFVTIEEPAWVADAARATHGLAHGDLAATFQGEEPGLPVLGAGTLAFLWHAPSVTGDAAPPADPADLPRFLREQGHEPLELLAAARLVLALLIVACLAASALLAARLLGSLLTVLGFGLLALDPFHLALSRLFHPDGLLSSLMLLATLLLLNYLYGSRRRALLGASAVVAGLAWLTRADSALFLAPWATLLLALPHWETWAKEGWQPALEGWLRPLALWAGIALATAILLWPALWVNPIDRMDTLLHDAPAAAEAVQAQEFFFGGRVVRGDPGPGFYPVTYLWRTTPLVLGGLVLALFAFAGRQGPLAEPTVRRLTILFSLWAFFFLLFISVDGQKSEGTLLPLFAPLDLVAAVGWGAAARWVAGWLPPRRAALALPGLFGAVLLAQGLGTLATFPVYLSYFNPLMGGSSAAPEAVTAGWGEGLEEAARTLAAKGDPSLRVLTAHPAAVAYFYEGDLAPLTLTGGTPLQNVLAWLETDYVLLYVDQWQRQAPTPDLIRYFDGLTPEQTVSAHGLEYARLYRVRDLPPPTVVTRPFRLVEWGDTIRLLAQEVPETLPAAGGSDAAPRVTFYLQAIAPTAPDLSVLVRLLTEDGREIWRDEGSPLASLTASWAENVVWSDTHTLTLPAEVPPGYYRLELGFYDNQSLQPLPAQDAQTGEPLSDFVTVDFLPLGSAGGTLSSMLEPAVEIGPALRLLGTDLGAGRVVARGQPLALNLFWQAQGTVQQGDRLVFIELLGADEQVVAQVRAAPLGGTYPPHEWPPGRTITDPYELPIASSVPPGAYTVRVGMVNPLTNERFPVLRAGRWVASSVVVGSVVVQ